MLEEACVDWIYLYKVVVVEWRWLFFCGSTAVMVGAEVLLGCGVKPFCWDSALAVDGAMGQAQVRQPEIPLWRYMTPGPGVLADAEAGASRADAVVPF